MVGESRVREEKSKCARSPKFLYLARADEKAQKEVLKEGGITN